MNEYYFIKKYGWMFLAGGMLFFLFFIIFLCSSSSVGSEEGVVISYFTIPFEDNVNYVITSKYGTRIDPLNNNVISFHNGLDVSAPVGTNIVSSADGVIHSVGYSESGLGNYVYIEHDFGGVVMYTMYGHMLDDSIVVKVGDTVKSKQKIGVIGSSGRSTGVHLHFMISKGKLGFTEEDLIDPILIFES